MRPKSSPPFLLFLGAAFACVTAASPARAGARAPADGPTRLWLEARPFTCDAQLPGLARELTLACDAAGGACVIASSESMADRRIVLHCSEEAWTVEATSPAGQRAWSVEVYGSDADRMRSAAVFAVRAETGEATRPHPTDPPPPAPRPAANREPDRADSPSDAPSIFSVAAAPRLSVAFGGDHSLMSGVAGYGALRLNRFFHAGITGAVEGGQTGDGGPPTNMHWHFSGGALLGIGAPFDRVPFGAFVESTYGAVLFTTDISQVTGTNRSAAQGFLSARAGLVYQLYETSAVRPWLALSGRQVWAGDSIGQLTAADTYASLDLGVVWDP